jgi:hypothetical protein
MGALSRRSTIAASDAPNRKQRIEMARRRRRSNENFHAILVHWLSKKRFAQPVDLRWYPRDIGSPVRTRLGAGGRWIRTIGPWRERAGFRWGKRIASDRNRASHKKLFSLRGTDSSNPPPSSRESVCLPRPEDLHGRRGTETSRREIHGLPHRRRRAQPPVAPTLPPRSALRADCASGNRSPPPAIEQRRGLGCLRRRSGRDRPLAERISPRARCSPG